MDATELRDALQLMGCRISVADAAARALADERRPAAFAYLATLAGMTQREAAEAHGVSDRTIRNVKKRLRNRCL